jgi:hypothetical protein
MLVIASAVEPSAKSVRTRARPSACPGRRSWTAGDSSNEIAAPDRFAQRPAWPNPAWGACADRCKRARPAPGLFPTQAALASLDTPPIFPQGAVPAAVRVVVLNIGADDESEEQSEEI